MTHSKTSIPASLPLIDFGQVEKASVFSAAVTIIFGAPLEHIIVCNISYGNSKNNLLTTANSLGSGWSDFLSWSGLGSESRGSLVLVLDNGKLGGLLGTTSFDRVVTAVTLGDVLDDQFTEVTRPSFFVFQDAKKGLFHILEQKIIKLPEFLLGDLLRSLEPRDVGGWLDLDHEDFDVTRKTGNGVHFTDEWRHFGQFGFALFALGFGRVFAVVRFDNVLDDEHSTVTDGSFFELQDARNIMMTHRL